MEEMLSHKISTMGIKHDSGFLSLSFLSIFLVLECLYLSVSCKLLASIKHFVFVGRKCWISTSEPALVLTVQHLHIGH